MSRLILIDIGNTRLKWALWDGATLQPGAPLVHGGRPAEALTALPGESATAIWVAQVLGAEHDTLLHDALVRRFKVEPGFARSSAALLGLTNAYAEPGRLGVDRWLMMLALWQAQRTAFCVAGAGTALTCDAVDDRGLHRGGFIAAGLTTHQAAVLGATRFATRDLEATYDVGLGRDTESCVRQGALLACVGALEQGWRAGGRPARRVIAGGDAPQLLPLLGLGWEYRPDLVLEGLLALALHQ